MTIKTLKYLFFFSCIVCFAACNKQLGQKSKKPLSQNPSFTGIKNVLILKDSFAVKNLRDSAVYRKIWLYLPPNYQTSQEDYPVIYMHDGQNLFDKKTSYAGEWKVDETLNEMYETTGKGFIVVGIENTGKERLNEYSPWKHEKYGGGSGDNYLDMIVSVLKPKIDQNYRTKPEADHTAIMGSSMGGLISYYAALKYPDVFGKVGVFSPSFWFSKSVFDYTEKRAKIADVKMFFLLGAKEGMKKEFDSLSELLLYSGFKKEKFIKKLVPGGEHNEALWSGQFKEVITWLYHI